MLEQQKQILSAMLTEGGMACPSMTAEEITTGVNNRNGTQYPVPCVERYLQSLSDDWQGQVRHAPLVQIIGLNGTSRFCLTRLGLEKAIAASTEVHPREDLTIQRGPIWDQQQNDWRNAAP